MREPRKILGDIIEDFRLDCDADELVDELRERGVILAAGSSPEEPAETMVQVGWAYVLKGQWHLCADEPVNHRARERVFVRVPVSQEPPKEADNAE